MNRLPAFIKARELFAHQRLLVFWLVALLAIVLPWLWLSIPDREPVPNTTGVSVAPGHHEPRSPGQAAR